MEVRSKDLGTSENWEEAFKTFLSLYKSREAEAVVAVGETDFYQGKYCICPIAVMASNLKATPERLVSSLCDLTADLLPECRLITMRLSLVKISKYGIVKTLFLIFQDQEPIHP